MTFRRTILLAILSSAWHTCLPRCTQSSHTKSICVPTDYVKFELPPESPTTVMIGVDIKDIPKVSDKDFSVTLNAYFIVKWKDSRVSVINNFNLTRDPDGSQPLTVLNLAILKDLWMPDVEIRNLQSFRTHTILSKLEGFWWTSIKT